jgi:small-conductance mechanosensitive channel/CRP-like cAMP-binding protein
MRFLVFAARIARACRPLVVPVVLFAATLGAYIELGSLMQTWSIDEQWRVALGRAVEISCWLTGALVLSRVVRVVVWNGIFTRVIGLEPPRLIVQLGGFIIFLLAVSGIVGVVFEQSVIGIWATSSAVGVVIGLAVQNLILDTFSGLALNIERPFKPGDWINVHTRFGEYIGRVVETNWRTTRLWTTGRNVITIPNSFMTTTVVTNYSRPDTVSRFELEFTLDFSVDTVRALRILNAALRGAIGDEGPLAEPEPKVRISAVGDHGIVYKARYYIDPIATSPSKARHTILASVMRHVSQAGLTLAYPKQDMFVARMPWRQQNWSSPKDQVRQLGKLSLFSTFDHEDLSFLVSRMRVSSYRRGQRVVEQNAEGDSMFILAEGLLEVRIRNELGDVKVADLVPGSFFGEKSLLTGEPRSASVVCATDAIICEIDKAAMTELFARNPEIAENLSRVITIRDMQNLATLDDVAREERLRAVNQETERFLVRIRSFFGFDARRKNVA